MSSCCGGKCGCGSSCSCGSNCNGCGKYPDLSYSESTTSVTVIMGVVPTEKPHLEGFEKGVEAGNNGGCNCGDNCSCNPCKCGK